MPHPSHAHVQRAILGAAEEAELEVGLVQRGDLGGVRLGAVAGGGSQGETASQQLILLTRTEE